MNTIIEKIKHQSTSLDSDIKTPVFILNSDKFKSNVIELCSAFRKYYPNYNLGYSYKTNYTSELCRIVDELGEYAEVVSPMEYNHALSLGVSKSKIIYNGVIADFNSKLDIALNGGIVNIDNLHELKQFYDYGLLNGVVIKIGLRLNIDIGNDHVSRFGIDVDSEHFRSFVSDYKHYIKDVLKVVGIHCHVSSGRDIEYWGVRADKMIEISRLFEGIRYIDLGGNMYGKMNPFLASQFGDIPTFDDYAKVVGTKFAKAFPDNRVKLITENGTPIVANCMSLLTKVTGTNLIRGKRSFILDCSSYDCGFIVKTKRLPHFVFNNVESSEVIADLYGYACTEEDCLIRNYKGRLAIGDTILFDNVGAYSNVLGNNFIQPTLGIIEIKDDCIKVICEPENNMFRRYK